MKTRKIKIAVLTGYVITLTFLFGSFILLLSSLQREIYLLLSIISYISVILFLILWNVKTNKKIFLLFSVPVLCLTAGIIINNYYEKINKIPTVDEREHYLYQYEPFRSGNYLAKLTKESGFMIDRDYPVMDGATALMPVYASFMQAVYQNEKFEKGLLLCSGTERAYNNLLDGIADIIFCAGPSESQMEQFTEKGLKIKLIPIGREAFVFFVNKENIVNDLTIDNIRGIYSGKIKNWKELNGNNQRIIAFQRKKNSGSQTMLEKIMDVPIKKPRRENVQGDMIGIINQVADYRNFSNAIGYSFLYYTSKMVQSNQIKLLSINGIYPSTETIQNNTYPFSDSFYAIYIDDENMNENIEPFIDWILSEQGQTLITKTGYVPIKN